MRTVPNVPLALLIAATLACAYPSVSWCATITYNAVADFSQTVNTNTSTWSYRVQPSAGAVANPGDLSAGPRTAAPPLLPVGGNATYLGSGSTTTGWTTGTSGSPTNPGILLSTQTEFLFGVLDIQPNHLYVAPNFQNGGAEVLSWLAPDTGTIDISFTLRVAHLGAGSSFAGGDLQWYIDKNGLAGNLAAGYVWGYNVPTGVANSVLLGVPVAAGDRINFVIDEGGTPANGFGEVDAVITFTAIPEPSTLVLAALGTTALGGGFWRRRHRAGPEAGNATK